MLYGSRNGKGHLGEGRLDTEASSHASELIEEVRQ